MLAYCHYIYIYIYTYVIEYWETLATMWNTIFINNLHDLLSDLKYIKYVKSY